MFAGECPDRKRYRDRLFSRANSRTLVVLACPPVFCRHTVNRSISRASKYPPATNFVQAPPMDVALWLITYRKRYSSIFHLLTSAQTRKTPSATSRQSDRGRDCCVPFNEVMLKQVQHSYMPAYPHVNDNWIVINLYMKQPLYQQTRGNKKT